MVVVGVIILAEDRSKEVARKPEKNKEVCKGKLREEKKCDLR